MNDSPFDQVKEEASKEDYVEIKTDALQKQFPYQEVIKESKMLEMVRDVAFGVAKEICNQQVEELNSTLFKSVVKIYTNPINKRKYALLDITDSKLREIK